MLSARFQLGRDPRPSPACKASTQLPASLSSTRGKKSWTSDPRLATNQQRCFSNPGDADVAVEHTPRHVLLELGTFRRASMEEALQHRTTLIFERVSGLDGHKWIVEIPAAQVPPPFSTRQRNSGRGISCDLSPRHPRSLTRNGPSWSSPKQATQVDVRDAAGQENPHIVPTTQHMLLVMLAVIVCPAVEADTRVPQTARKTTRTCAQNQKRRSICRRSSNLRSVVSTKLWQPPGTGHAALAPSRVSRLLSKNYQKKTVGCPD